MWSYKNKLWSVVVLLLKNIAKGITCGCDDHKALIHLFYATDDWNDRYWETISSKFYLPIINAMGIMLLCIVETTIVIIMIVMLMTGVIRLYVKIHCCYCCCWCNLCPNIVSQAKFGPRILQGLDGPQSVELRIWSVALIFFRKPNFDEVIQNQIFTRFCSPRLTFRRQTFHQTTWHR